MILIRCDSSTEIGTGHVFRCLALAHRLQKNGETVEFVCRDLPGNVSETPSRQGFPVHLLKAQEDDLDFLKLKAKSLGSANGVKPWLVVDHYQIDRNWELALRDSFRIFVIDDLFNRPHFCDVILDQNFHGPSGDLYRNLVPPGTTQMMGPRYCLLREEFIKAPAQILPITQRNKSCLVFFGGGDRTGETQRFIEALRYRKSGLHFDVVISQSHPHVVQLQNAVLPASVTLHVSPQKISELMLQNQIYFGSGGTVTWERMALGLPGIVVSVANNQSKIAEALALTGLQVYLGVSQTIDYVKAIESIEKQVNDAFWLQETSNKNMSLVRPVSNALLKALFSFRGQGVELRLASMNDAKFILDLRNDLETRKMSVSTDAISWEGHLEWLGRSLSDPHFRIYIGTKDGIPFGQFRVRPDLDTGIMIAASFRGQGLSKTLIEMGSRLYLSEFSQINFLEAKIKSSNIASKKGFEQAGYVFKDDIQIDGENYDRFIFSSGQRGD